MISDYSACDCAPMHELPFGHVQESVCGCVQITQREFQLTEDFTAPKGALLMPSLIASSMQVKCMSLAVMPPTDTDYMHP